VREKLNENPAAQIGLIALLVAVAAFMLLGGGLGGGGEEEESAEAPVTEIEGVVPGEPLTAEAGVPGEIAAFSEETAASIPAPPLPRPVQKAYKADKTVVLLVVHDGGIDDPIVRRFTRDASDSSSVKLFVVPAKQIARYAGITLGVNVQQLPALVAVRPKRLSHGQIEASAVYGFQSPQRIDQVIRDAEYNGPETTYHPQ
jgi:hypothetical protein